MPDLDAIRARHFPSLTDDGDRCRDEGDLWPCDTAIVLAALDAALARERRLLERVAGMGLCSQTHHEHLAADARAALAETPEAGS